LGYPVPVSGNRGFWENFFMRRKEVSTEEIAEIAVFAVICLGIIGVIIGIVGFIRPFFE
jgi:hypothetical protein